MGVTLPVSLPSIQTCDHGFDPRVTEQVPPPAGATAALPSLVSDSNTSSPPAAFPGLGVLDLDGVGARGDPVGLEVGAGLLRVLVAARERLAVQPHEAPGRVAGQLEAGVGRGLELDLQPVHLAGLDLDVLILAHVPL